MTYAHLGGFYCPNCGYERPQANIAVNTVIEENCENSVVELRIHGRTVRRTIPLPALYNVYNYLAALTAVTAFGLSDLPDFSGGETVIGFGRMEHFDIGAGVTMILVKNPAGFSQIIEYLSGLSSEYDLLCCLNDKPQDGTDISWIWDAPLEALSDNGNHRWILRLYLFQFFQHRRLSFFHQLDLFANLVHKQINQTGVSIADNKAPVGCAVPCGLVLRNFNSFGPLLVGA